MKNKTLHFLLIFCCSYFWLMRLNAQSNIGVNIGLDFMEAKPEPLSFPIYIVGKGFKSQSISFGLRFEQQLSKLFFLSAQGNYSRKRMIAWGAWSPPFDSIAFHRYSAALSINWMPFYFLNIGAGPSGIYSPKIDAYNLGSYRHKLEHERKELGILITVGGIYKQAMLDVNY